MTLHRLAVSVASRQMRIHSFAVAASRSLSTSAPLSSSSSSADGGGEDGATGAAAESLAEAAAAALSSSSSFSPSSLLLLPDASAPVAAAASLIDSLGPNSGSFVSLPWWAAIPTAAVAVRAALLPLAVAQARSAAAFGPLMQRAREEEEEEAAAAAEEEGKAAMAAAAAEAEAEAAAAPKEDEDEENPAGKGIEAREQEQQRRRRRRPPSLLSTSTLRRVLALRQQTSSPHPLWLVASPLLQIPVFASAVLGVRAMANAEWPGFGEGGALWFSDLTARAVEVVSSSSPISSSASSLASLTAPMGVAGGVLPALVAAGTLAAAAAALGGGAPGRGAGTPPLAGAPRSSPQQALLRLLLEWLALPAFVGSLLLPQGAVLYWASSSWAALVQGTVLRSNRARELLGLQEIARRAAASSGGGNRGAGEGASPRPLLSPSTPPAALAHLSRAAELRAAGDVEKAIGAASAAVAASGGASARAWFALGQLRAAAAHWHDAELAFGECARLEEEEAERARSGSGEPEGSSGDRDDEDGERLVAIRGRKHEAARALFGAGVAQSMQGDGEAASGTLRRAVAAAEEAFGGAEAVEAELQRRRRRRRTLRKKSSSTPAPLPPPLATLARSLLALASALDAQKGRTAEALAVARRAAALDEGAERMAVSPLVEKLRKEEEGSGGSGL